MDRPSLHPDLELLQGGKGTGDEPDGPPAARPVLRVVPGGRSPELDAALADAVEAARRMRQEIERRIARALEGLDDQR